MGGDGLPYAPIVGAMRDLVTQHGREQILEWAGAGRRALGALVPDLGTAPRENDDTIRLRLYEAAHCSISQQLKELLGQRSRWCGRPRARRNIIAGRALHDRLVFAGSAVDIGRRTATVGDIVETTERQPVPGKGVIMTYISTATAAVCTQ